MTISNKTYTILKWLVQLVLPALGTCYFALCGIWGFPYGEEVVGTIAAVTTFLGVILGITGYNYDKSGKGINGTLIIDKLPDDILESAVVFNEPIEDISDKDRVKLKVETEG